MSTQTEIKKLLLAILEDSIVVSRGILVQDVDSIMECREQGSYRFEILDTISNMISEGTLKAIKASRPGSKFEKTLIMLVDASLNTPVQT